MTQVESGRLLDVGDTKLWVDERGRPDGVPLLVLHGGPGDDHTEFGDYLDPLGEDYRLVLVDQRAQGRSERDVDPASWTLEQMAVDVSSLAASLGTETYVVLGHSFGAFVALRHAVQAPGAAAATVVSHGVPAPRFMDVVEANLATFEPVELREQVAASWAREAEVATEEDFAALMHDQLPFHFADPRDPRIADYERRSAGARWAPDVLRHFSVAGFGGLDVEDRLGEVVQPVLVLGGRFDRVCSVEAAEVTAAGLPRGELVVFEHSAHMSFAEEPERYVEVVRDFLARTLAP